MEPTLNLLILDVTMLNGKYQKELGDCNEHLSTARKAGLDFVESVYHFFSNININDEEGQRIRVSFRRNDSTPVQHYFYKFQSNLQKCRHLFEDFQDKLHGAKRQCQQTERECKQQEKEAHYKKFAAIGIGAAASGTVAVTAGFFLLFLHLGLLYL